MKLRYYPYAGMKEPAMKAPENERPRIRMIIKSAHKELLAHAASGDREKAADELMGISKQLAVLGHIRHAIVFAEKALQYNPHHRMARFNLAAFYGDIGQYGKTLELLDGLNAELSFHDELKSEVLTNRGIVKSALGWPMKNVFDDFVNAVRTNPLNVQARGNVAECLILEGKADEAIPIIQRAMKIEMNPYLVRLMASAHDKAGRQIIGANIALRIQGLTEKEFKEVLLILKCKGDLEAEEKDFHQRLMQITKLSAPGFMYI